MIRIDNGEAGKEVSHGCLSRPHRKCFHEVKWIKPKIDLPYWAVITSTREIVCYIDYCPFCGEPLGPQGTRLYDPEDRPF